MRGIDSASMLNWQASAITDEEITLLVDALNNAEREGKSSKLEVLYLNDNLVSDSGIAQLVGCTNLKQLHHLSVARNKIGNVGAQSILDAFKPGGNLPNLREINLIGNGITDPAVTIRSSYDA